MSVDSVETSRRIARCMGILRIKYPPSVLDRIRELVGQDIAFDQFPDDLKQIITSIETNHE